MQAGDITLITRGCKGAAPHQRVTEAVVEGTQSRATDVQLAGISAALVTRHLQQTAGAAADLQGARWATLTIQTR